MAVSPPDPEWVQAAKWFGDPNARKEKDNFKHLQTLEQAKRNVDLAVHGALAVLLPISVALAFLLFWIGVVIYAIHLLTPWKWLTPDQEKELHTVLFSGVVGATVAGTAKRYLGISKSDGADS